MSTWRSLPQSHVPPRLDWAEKMVLASKLVLLICYAAGTFIRRTMSRSDFSIRALRRNITPSLSSNLLRALSLREMRSFLTPSGVTITRFCASKKLKHQAVQLDDTDGFPPAALHLIDCTPEDAGDTLLYFHGGGYVFPITSATLSLGQKAATSASAALVVLEYTIAPDVEYPGQLAQAAASLRFLLQKRQGDPSRIIIAGDSAGGNLTLALLAHLQDPHPRVTPVEFATEGQKLRAALCVSPRTNNIYTAPSYSFNGSKDYLSSDAVRLFTSNWQPAGDEVWASPVSGSKAFWEDAHASKVLLVVGGDEVYLDDVKTQAELMNAGSTTDANIQLRICPGEVHDQPILDFGQGIEDGCMTIEILSWLRALPPS
ncbi:MAG: hypothetical protein M1822_003014 [Bathelium mastoideum]|nr:MAG: hypothetical protein M1822_003014 [Bathelium mastoideum]